MMRADGLFPGGFHPYLQLMTPDILHRAKYLYRRDVRLIKYYFIDFGISLRFNESDTNRLVYGFKGMDREVPELFDGLKYDPFPLDIFILGNFYRRTLVEVRP